MKFIYPRFLRFFFPFLVVLWAILLNPPALPGKAIFDGAQTIREYGAKGDGVSDDTDAFFEAKKRNNGIATIIIPKGTYRISTELALPSGISLVFLSGAQVKVDANMTVNGIIHCLGGGAHFEINSGSTLIIKNHLEAGRYQVFAGQGKVDFAGGGTPKIYVDWWKSGSDHTSAVRAAIRAAQLNGTNLVVLPATCTITETINVPSAMIIEGTGWETIVNFIPTSPSGQPAFHTRSLSPSKGSDHVVFRDFQLKCHKGEYGFKIGEDDGGVNVWYGEGCQIRNVLIQDFTKAAIWLRRTIRFYAENVKTYNNNGKWGDDIVGLLVNQGSDNIDGNNLATFINCHFGHTKRHAVYLHNSGRGFTFINCDFENTGHEGVYVLKDSKLTNTYLGNITLKGCWFESHNLAPGRTNGDYASLKVAWTGGKQEFWPVQIIGCTFQGAGKGNPEIYANNAEVLIMGGSIGRKTGNYIDNAAIKAVGRSRVSVLK
jgi:pectate lyase